MQVGNGALATCGDEEARRNHRVCQSWPWRGPRDTKHPLALQTLTGAGKGRNGRRESMKTPGRAVGDVIARSR